VLEGLDGPKGLAEDLRDLLGGEVAEHAQEDHVLLVGRELRKEVRDALGAEGAEGILFRVAGRAEPLDLRRRSWLRGAASVAPALVEQPVVGDRERPGFEVALAAVEAREVADDLEHDLAEQVVGVARPLRAEVAEQRGRELGVDGAPGSLLAGPGRLKGRLEVLPRDQVILRTRARAKGQRATIGRDVTANALRKLCLEFPGAYEDFPFGPETSVFKVEGKLFAITALASTPLKVSLKCEPELAEELRGSYPDAVAPGYHLNKRHWNTVMCDGMLSDAMVRDMVEDSYDLIVAAMPAAVRERLGWTVSA
jgi:predicted DNA-binding protein (MmcQ/YjbR family)